LPFSSGDLQTPISHLPVNLEADLPFDSPSDPGDDSFPFGANAPPVELPPHPDEAKLNEWNRLAGKKKCDTVVASGKRGKRP
jgi:hypothetical protein